MCVLCFFMLSLSLQHTHSTNILSNLFVRYVCRLLPKWKRRLQGICDILSIYWYHSHRDVVKYGHFALAPISSTQVFRPKNSRNLICLSTILVLWGGDSEWFSCVRFGRRCLTMWAFGWCYTSYPRRSVWIRPVEGTNLLSIPIQIQVFLNDNFKSIANIKPDRDKFAVIFGGEEFNTFQTVRRTWQCKAKQDCHDDGFWMHCNCRAHRISKKEHIVWSNAIQLELLRG